MSKYRKQHMKIDWFDMIDPEQEQSAVEAELKEKASLVGRVGLMMLSVGTGAWRVRASMNKIAKALGIVCVADIGLLSIEYTCVDKNETCTNAFSINTTGVNTDKLNSLEYFADGFADRANHYSVVQFHKILDRIEHKPANYSAWKLGLASAFACGAFTFLLGGGWVEMLFAFFGAGVGMFLRKKLMEQKVTLFANLCLSVAAAGFVYIVLMKLAEWLGGVSEVHQAGYICSMLFVIPGFPIITGGIDLAKLDLRSGLERLTYAGLVVLMATLTGWVMAMLFHYVPADFVELEIDTPMKILFRALASFVGVYGFSYLFNSTRRMALTAGLIGMVANTLRLELIDFTDIPVSLAAFLAALTAGLLASAIKKKIGYPRITVTIPSIVIMVPGMFLYKGIYYIGFNDITNGAMWLTKAFLIIIALPVGLVAARILTDTNFRKSS